MRKKSRFLKSQQGFSLIELMLVVAIIGVLSSIAIPKYQNFIRIIRINSTKSHLSSLYAMEKAYYAEYMAYTSRLDAIGFQMEGKVYFNIGFTDDFPPPPEAPQGTTTCIYTCQGIIHPQCGAPASAWQCMGSASYGLDGTVRGSVGPGTFTATAHAHLADIGGSGPTTDPVTLSITDSKLITDHPNAN